MTGSQGEGAPILPDPSAPMQIGRYTVARELGRGGMGIVYEATDPAIGRRLAIKVINLQFMTGEGEAQVLRERLFREARSAGALSHPGIVGVYDVGEDRAMAFIAMEFVDGPSLQQIQRSSGKLEPADVVDMLAQVAAALDYAHRNGVVHRDIKPPNIMIHQGAQVKIADFGIAKITNAPKYTVTGMVMGTPAYMSPEQIEGREVDGRSDQFSLAVVAYELLTGMVPFQGKTYVSMVHSIVYGERPSAQAANPLLPVTFDAVLARGMAARPGDRFANCAEFVAALRTALYATAPLATTQPATVPQPTVQAATAQAASRQQTTIHLAPPPAAAQPRAVRRVLLLAAALGFLTLAFCGAAIYRFWPEPQSSTGPQAQEARPPVAAAGAPIAAPSVPTASQATPPTAPADSPPPLPEQQAAAETATPIETAKTPAKKKAAVAIAELPTKQPKKAESQPRASVPQPPTTLTVDVKSTQAWTDTGIDLRATDTATITATGAIQIAADKRIAHQQPGGFYPDCRRPKELFGQPVGPVAAPNLNCWSLIGRVGQGGTIFEIGIQGTAPAGSAGRLFLGANDDDYTDNSGSWSAVITVEHK